MKDIAESIPPARKRLMSMKLSTAVTLMISSVIGSVLLLVYALWFIQISDTTRDGVKDTALAVARTFADMPEVKQALTLPPQSGLIQPLALTITRRNDLLYAVVTDMRGIRYSHPNPGLLVNSLSARIFSPPLMAKRMSPSITGCWPGAARLYPGIQRQQQQIGVVVVGISLSKVDEQIAKGRWDVLLTVLFSALVCGIGTWSLVRGLKRVLLGLEPQEISTQFQQRQAMLHSLKEGVVAVDVEGRVTLINPAASEILLSGPGKEIAHTPLLADLQRFCRPASRFTTASSAATASC
jgi:two-component system sensor histidine kinase DcuS